MSFNLNDEKATYTLIWWMEGSDGNIGKDEENTVEAILDDLGYSMQAFQQKTKMHISGMSSSDIDQLVDEAIQWGAENFSEAYKTKLLEALKAISDCDGKKDDEQVKLQKVKQAFGEAS